MSSSKIDLSTLKSFCDETVCLWFAERVVHQCWTWSFSHGLFPFSQLLTFELDSPYLVNGCCQESWESWKRDAGYFHVHHYFLDKYLSWWNLLALLIRTQILVFANWLLTVALQAPLSMGFSRQGYWSGLPCPPAGDLPGPGIEPVSPDWQVDSLPRNHLGSPSLLLRWAYKSSISSWY